MSILSFSVVYILVTILGLTPPGWFFITENIWETALSPFLVWSYPLTAYMIYNGYGQNCRSVSDMVRNSQSYQTIEFIQQLTYRENRSTAPFVMVTSMFTASLAELY